MKRHHPAAILILAFVFSFAFAILWVVVMTLTLPKSDGAYGQAPFADPLVLPVMCVGACAAAMITYPFLYFALREREFPRAPYILAGVVISEILVVTPFNGPLGFVGTFVAYFIGLFAARRWSPLNVLPGHCKNCGYNLFGTPTDHPCPECGAAGCH